MTDIGRISQEFKGKDSHADTLVIGSGPGGAITATVLAENRRDVLLIEEGSRFRQQLNPPFGITEMEEGYRSGGMTVAFGRCFINYVEGRCLGGGSEVNSGLYHRPPPETLRRWNERNGVQGVGGDLFSSLCEQNERDINVVPAPGEVQPASRLFADGAKSLRWKCTQIPRWHRYDDKYSPLCPGGVRQSMSETFLPRFAVAGGRLATGCEARKLRRSVCAWEVDVRQDNCTSTITCKDVFVACGAVRTPSLLRRSGIRLGFGNSLRMHVFARVIAEFPAEVNSLDAGIGPHQIEQFVPRVRMGCAVSTPELMALALALSDPHWLRDHLDKWPYRSVYYAAIGGGCGFVRALPAGEAVLYRLNRDDYYDLSDGIRALCRALFCAGARRILPVMTGAPTLFSASELWKLPRPLTARHARLSSVHLMASCPMGATGPVDSLGKIRGLAGLHVADASLFCDSPNVNPQGTVMALARRNALAHVGAWPD